MTSLRTAIRAALRRQATRAAKARVQKFRDNALALGADPDEAMSAEMSRRRRLGIERKTQQVES